MRIESTFLFCSSHLSFPTPLHHLLPLLLHFLTFFSFFCLFFIHIIIKSSSIFPFLPSSPASSSFSSCPPHQHHSFFLLLFIVLFTPRNKIQAKCTKSKEREKSEGNKHHINKKVSTEGRRMGQRWRQRLSRVYCLLISMEISLFIFYVPEGTCSCYMREKKRRS